MTIKVFYMKHEMVRVEFAYRNRYCTLPAIKGFYTNPSKTTYHEQFGNLKRRTRDKLEKEILKMAVEHYPREQVINIQRIVDMGYTFVHTAL